MKTLLQRTPKVHDTLTQASYALLSLNDDSRYTGQYIIIYRQYQDNFKIVKRGLSPDGYSYTHSGIWQFWDADQAYDYIYND